MPSLLIYGIVALGIIGSLSGIGWKLNHDGYVRGHDEVKAQWDEANAKAAKDAAQKDAQNAKAKEKADADAAKTRRDLAGLYTAYRSLRDQRERSLLPQAPSGSSNPPTATFDRAALDRALQGFDRGVTGLLEEGDNAIADLNSARKWAGSLPPPR